MWRASPGVRKLSLLYVEGSVYSPFTSVVTGAVVKQVGITEEQYRTWVELEMAEFSVPLHCRQWALWRVISNFRLTILLDSRCNRSFLADRQDLEETDTISCPCKGCNHMWCKHCQQSISQGGPKHSCNGVSELEHLMAQRRWRYCPSKSYCHCCLAPAC